MSNQSFDSIKVAADTRGELQQIFFFEPLPYVERVVPILKPYKIVGKPFSDEPYGIGVKKNQNGDRQGFVPFVNTWLAGMIQDGTWGKLYEKHITPVSGDKKTSPKG